jgi:O-antigen ligase
MKKLIITLIILSGIFYYAMVNQDRFYPAQWAFFIFSAGILGSLLLYEKNKWMGLLAGLCSLMFLKTFLFQHAPQFNLFENMLTGIGIFGIYYAVRQFNLTEDYLKWFLIPAILNIILIIIQTFDHNFLSFMPVNGVQGFLGNPSVSGCFIAMTTLIFVKFFPHGLFLLFFAIVLTKSITAITIFLTGLLCYAWLGKYPHRMILTILCVLLAASGLFYQRQRILSDVRHRSAMYLGTLDGIKHNPILGWGIGSFEPIMSKIKPEDSRYGWGQFNYQDAIMNHPHNEILYGWWNMGIMFPVLFFGLLWQVIRKFKRENALSFSILMGGVVCMMGYFLQPPLWFLLMMGLGIYHNQEV